MVFLRAEMRRPTPPMREQVTDASDDGTDRPVASTAGHGFAGSTPVVMFDARTLKPMLPHSFSILVIGK